MSVSALKRKFYKVYNKYYDFIERLVENKSGGLTILYCSHVVLDYYFNNYEYITEDDEVVYYFSDEENLVRVINFFIERINVLVELDNIYNEDDFEEIVPIMYTKLKYEELLKTYKEELEKHNLVERIENTILELNNYIDNGIFLPDEKLDEIEFEFESYMEYVDIDDVLSADIFTVYQCMVYGDELDELDEEDDYEDLDEENYDDNQKVTLEFLKVQFSLLMKSANEEFGGKLLTLKRSSWYYKMIIKYKRIIDKILFVCEVYEDDIEKLSEKLGFDFVMISMFCVSLYLESIRLLEQEYSYLNIESISSDKFNDYKKYLILVTLVHLLLTVDKSITVEEFAGLSKEILNDIYENDSISQEFLDLYEQYQNDFLTELELEYESIDDLFDGVYKKLSHLSNEYY